MNHPLMHRALIQQVTEQVSVAANLYYQLILVVGAPRTGKTAALRRLAEEQPWLLININLSLSEQLLELTVRQRALKVPSLLDQLVQQNDHQVLILDNTELLFDPLLQQDPLRLLQGISRNRTVIVAWSGEYDGHSLTFAIPSHPEFRSYTEPETIIVDV